jgi:hypothetical protein
MIGLGQILVISSFAKLLVFHVIFLVVRLLVGMLVC